MHFIALTCLLLAVNLSVSRVFWQLLISFAICVTYLAALLFAMAELGTYWGHYALTFWMLVLAPWVVAIILFCRILRAAVRLVVGISPSQRQDRREAEDGRPE